MTDEKNIVTAVRLNGSKLDTKHVVLLKRMPMTMWKSGPHTAKSMPYLGSIIETGNRDKQTKYVAVAYGDEKKLNPSQSVTPIFSILGKPVKQSTHVKVLKFLRDHNVVYPLASKHNQRSNRGHKTSRHVKVHGYSHSDKIKDQKKFKSMHCVEVVSGYHIGMKSANKAYREVHPYIDTRKDYNFKVDDKTRFLHKDNDHTIAVVLTAKGIGKIVIDHKQYASGSKSIPLAKHLEPVISFTGKPLTNRWLRNLYKNNILNKESKK